jgi:predicted double-glycine peptidase
MNNTIKVPAVALVFAVGLAVGAGMKSAALSIWKNPATLQSHEENLHLLLTVPDVRQDTDYSCGASALQAVLAYWGIDVRESTLIKALRTDPKNGTRPEEIIRVARDYGLRAEIREGIGIPDLRRAWQNEIPVIVDIQAWQDNPNVKPVWENDWEDGHYVVVIGIDERNIYVEDPSLLGSRGVIPQTEFLKRWHDYEGEPPYNSRDRTYVHLGMFIEGTRRSTAVTFTPVQ